MSEQILGEIQRSLGRIEGKLDAVQEEVGRHDEAIDKLNAHKSRTLGAIAAGSGISGVLAWFASKTNVFGG
jgi:hypothetical protein